ncbi:MAG: prepilin-type N-terminal cleavage/methylation domain-containing protein [Deltaproteobacteria bacterium]|nr:prepilin-type N-terminal cleavage/methylation domain-containing protein [Deltaproteobacteria bacterium]
MKTSAFSKRREKGFTLLEIIITLTIAAILATFLVTFMGTALTKSGEPVVRSKQLYELQQVMENVKATYMTMADATDALTRLQQFATNATGATTSRNYGSYTIDAKCIIFDASGSNYVERAGAYTGSGYALKLTVTSNATQGLSVTEVFTQRP